MMYLINLLKKVICLCCLFVMLKSPTYGALHHAYDTIGNHMPPINLQWIKVHKVSFAMFTCMVQKLLNIEYFHHQNFNITKIENL
jgi:hypothetical protein